MSVRGQRILSGIVHEDEMFLHADSFDFMLNPHQGGSIIKTTALPSSSSMTKTREGMTTGSRRPRRHKEVPDVYGQVHPHETPELIAEKLVALDAEVGNLPKDKKISLMMAQERCPQLLTNAFKLQFLRCDVFRVKVSLLYFMFAAHPCRCLGWYV